MRWWRTTRGHGTRPTAQEQAARPAGDLLLTPLPEVLSGLGCDAEGLPTDEAARRLGETGPNVLVARNQNQWMVELLRQLVHPLALLLWLAALLALLTQGTLLAGAIVTVIALNAAFALAQERHAANAVSALSAYLPPQATVLRGGSRARVEASEVVPGDVLVVEEGDAVCADARLVSGAVEVDLSAVTGESVPVLRRAAPPDEAGEPSSRVVDAPDVLLSGTTCTAGDALAVVVATGMSTELGRIAGLSRRAGQGSSPLEKQVRKVAWLIAGVAVGIGVAFLPLGMLAGLSFTQAAVFAIGLLVANVPEGLLPTITLALAVGVSELARAGGLVKRLSAVETLGSTDVICTDKTGTLTQNRVQVHSVWEASATATPRGPSAATIARVLHHCSTADRESRLGDPTELALLTAVDRLGAPEEVGAVRERLLQFDPRLRLMSVVVAAPDGSTVVMTKGAPEAVLDHCDVSLPRDELRARDGVPAPAAAETPVPLTGAVRQEVEHRLAELAGQGLRLIACAQRSVSPAQVEEEREELESHLCLVGFVALVDPIRDAVPDAVRAAHSAGIRVHVITGDNGATAAAIAHAAGIGGARGPRVVTGTVLESLDDHELDAVLAQNGEIVFARSSPEDKLRIATRLQARGHVVAMTGDGVNDAPALRQADIGVAMGVGGTDVAREAATMVLTDDDFATIIRAIASGRRVYANVRKFIVYIFAHAVPEIVPFLVFALSGGSVPLGLTVAQILMIDLGTETLPALALGREAAEPGQMEQPPRSSREQIIQPRMLFRAWGLLGVVSAALVMLGYLWVLQDAGWRPGDDTSPGSPLHEGYLQATTMTFAGVVSCQVGTAMAARTDRASLRSVGVLGNRLLLAGIAFEIALTALVIYLPLAQDVLGTRALDLRQVLVLLTFPVIVWGADELYRAELRRRSASRRSTASTRAA